MASSAFPATGDSKDQPRPGQHQMSPKNSSFKKPWPPAPASCARGGQQQGGGGVPKCVCAPATHAGSFKCRLHRVNSQGHSPPTTPPGSSASASSSSTRSIEAL